ncbi:MAG: TOBE domain-containing protein [Haloarculaceae archaeon]
MDVDVEASLRAGDVAVDETDVALLRAVDERGSLNAAADALGRSYSRAHKRLTELEAAFGPLVDRERGGAGGGGSALTDGGHDLLARFARVRAVLAGTAGVEEVVLSGEVRAHDGELVTVETEAGTVRALADDADARVVGQHVEVTLTADAVTLHDPEGSPTDEEMSARNRLQGVVESIDEREAIATVRVDVGTARPLSVLVTTESSERLGLAHGSNVLATFKATAARATPRDSQS